MTGRMAHRATLTKAVIPRESGVSSTLRPLGSITTASGILDHPLEPVIGLAEGETSGAQRCSGRASATA